MFAPGHVKKFCSKVYVVGWLIMLKVYKENSKSAVPVHTRERLLFTPIINATLQRLIKLKVKLYSVYTAQSVQAK